MEEKLELSDDDCRRYYQLVQKNVSPEKTEYIHKPSFVIHEGSNQDEEDLGLAFNDFPQTSNTILPRRATLRYFEKEPPEDDIEDEDAEYNKNGFKDSVIQNGDGHYIIEDDAWSDYWDSGVDDIDDGIMKYMLPPTQTGETSLNSAFYPKQAQHITDNPTRTFSKEKDSPHLMKTIPISLADELSAATRHDGRLEETISDNVLEPITCPLTPDDDIPISDSDTEKHTPKNIIKNVLHSDTVYSKASNSKAQSSSSSSTTDSLRESISPPPLCPISSSYFSSDVEKDHDESDTIKSNDAEAAIEDDETAPQQPWLQHIPKHYSLDYDFSDDWDLVIAGTTAATVLKDTESLDMVVRHQPEGQIIPNPKSSEVAQRNQGRKFVIQHITGGNGIAGGILDASTCGAASRCCVIQ